MSFQLLYHPLVVKQDIPKLDAIMRSRIKSAIEEKLTVHPEIFGIPLRQSLQGHRKLRVGDWRIAFRIEKQTVKIIAILHRSIVYKVVEKRTMRP